jgi:hypothetical protein
VVSSCTALQSLNLYACNVTGEGVRAVVSSCPGLKSLNLSYCCGKVTDVGVRALISLPALTFLDLRGFYKVTAAGLQALRSTTAASTGCTSCSLHIKF